MATMRDTDNFNLGLDGMDKVCPDIDKWDNLNISPDFLETIKQAKAEKIPWPSQEEICRDLCKGGCANPTKMEKENRG